MKFKRIICLMMAFIMCFSVPLAAGAQSISAKDLMIAGIRNMENNYGKDLYKKSRGKEVYRINRLNGLYLYEISHLDGGMLELDYEFDTPGQKAAIEASLTTGRENVKSRFFLEGSRFIFDKNLIDMLKVLYPDEQFAPATEEYPEYLYIDSADMGELWDFFALYNNNPQMGDFKELAIFVLEAIPDRCFSVSLNRAVLELNHADFEETAANLLEKVKTEKERFADIITMLLASFHPQATPAELDELRTDIVTGIDEAVAAGTFPGRDEIQKIAGYAKLEHLRYQASLLPGGAKNLDMRLIFQEKSGFSGHISLSGESDRKHDGLKGSYHLGLNMSDDSGIQINGDVKGNYTVNSDSFAHEVVIGAATGNKTMGITLFDFELGVNSTMRSTPDLEIAIPGLNPSNSLKLSDQPGYRYLGPLEEI